jgi:outer membrane protein assembly factor BamB
MILKNRWLLAGVALCLCVSVRAQQGPHRVALGDWPEQRGPKGDGTSAETGLPDKWAINGENFLWRVPYGGRSAPVVMGNRVYVENPAGRDDQLQERVMALDADTGKVVWEYRFNVFQSDVPAHRVGWASPAVDPETGNIYAFGAGATALALNKDGKLLWQRSLGEENAAFTTHGGRTESPILDGDLVIVSSPISSWGTMAARQHRFVAMDKRTGDIVYSVSPGGRPYDTAYAPPLITTINGQRLLIDGIGDGGVYAIKPQTGEKVWGFVSSKRAINTGVVVKGSTVIVSHEDENIDVPERGLIAAIDGSQTGDIKKTLWKVTGTQFGFSSPVIDGDLFYEIDDADDLHAYSVATGKEAWHKSLGTVQKAPLVLADGKIYVGTEAGKFFILRPHPDRVEVLSEVEMPLGTVDNAGQSQGIPEPIFGGAAISHGRVFFASTGAVYAFGPKRAKALTGWAVDEPVAKGDGAPASLQVEPTELVMKPGQTVKLHARLFDEQGRFLREEKATWSLDGLKGTVADGTFTVAGDPKEQAGLIKAAVGELKGEARARIVRPMPWTETFESYPDGASPPGWINATLGKFNVVTLDGQKVLQKAADDSIMQRLRLFFGPVDWSNYTVEADVRSNEKRRQMADIGITAQRYTLSLYGNDQKIRLEPWEPEIHRTVTAPFSWKPDAWYHLKLRVENTPDGKVRIRGKAWPTGQPEPAAWLIEKVDPIGNHQGAPGLFAAAQFGAYFDNLQITPNN